MSFIEYLIEKGFKPYRKIYDKLKKLYEYIEDNNLTYFSSIVPGCIDIRLIKDDIEIIWGLHEGDHSPILIWPKLSSKVKDKYIDRIFKAYSYDLIFNMIMKQYETNI